MGKKIRLTESELTKLVLEMVTANEMALSHQDFQTSEDLSDLRAAIDSNKIVSVAFVKKDGTVRHMAIKKYLGSYVASDRPKTEKQLNVDSNNDMTTVVDINAYIKLVKSGMEKRDAASKSYRKVLLGNVLGFLVSGRFKDLRQENDIQERYGDEIFNSLTKSMVRSMEAEQNQQAQDLENQNQN
jgi:hypothetical protein